MAAIQSSSAISHVVLVLTKWSGVKCVSLSSGPFRAASSVATVAAIPLQWDGDHAYHTHCIWPSHTLSALAVWSAAKGIPPEFIFWSWCICSTRGFIEVKRYRVVFIYLFMSCSYPYNFFNLPLSAESDWNQIKFQLGWDTFTTVLTSRNIFFFPAPPFRPCLICHKGANMQV